MQELMETRIDSLALRMEAIQEKTDARIKEEDMRA
jgi:hypothetical protein